MRTQFTKALLPVQGKDLEGQSARAYTSLVNCTVVGPVQCSITGMGGYLNGKTRLCGIEQNYLVGRTALHVGS